MSRKKLDDLKKKVSSKDLEIETDAKTEAEVAPRNEVVVVKKVENVSNKSGSSSSGSNISRGIKITRCKSAPLNHEYDRRLNPDAPVFVPRKSTCSLTSSSLAHKNFTGGDEEKNTSCGAVYDSIWNENPIAPGMPPMQAHLTRPKLPSSRMMMSPPISRHFQPYGATNSAVAPGFRNYLTPQGFYELRRTQSNLLALQQLNMYTSANAPQPPNHSHLNVQKKLSPSLPMKSMPNVAYMTNSPADGEKVEGNNNNNAAEGSKTEEVEETKEMSPIKSKMRGLLVQKSRDNNYDPCDIKNGRDCCCSLM